MILLHSLYMPVRYIRKLFFCLGVLMSNLQAQAMMLATNAMFLCFFGCQTGQFSLTSKVIVGLEVGFMGSSSVTINT
jgi:hypothetical protein